MAIHDELTDIKKQLHKTLTIVKEFTEIFKDLQKSSKTKIKSVANLTEQLQSCVRVKHLELPVLTEFPDVRDRLVNKLTSDITDDLQQLKQNVDQLTDHSEGLAKQYDQCLMKFNKHNTQDNLPLLARQTAVFPSISDMMEMVEWCDSRLRASCLCKKYILEEFSPEMYEETDSLDKAWFKGDAEMFIQIHDYLTITSHFMEEKIS